MNSKPLSIALVVCFILTCQSVLAEVGVDWAQATSAAPWSARDGHTTAVYDGKLWVLGGADSNDVWYTTDGVNWTQATAAAAWSPRRFHTSAVYDGKLWVIGGNSSTPTLNDVWYTTDGVNWTQATSNAGWSVRDGHTSAVYDGKLWVLGGYDNNSTSHHNDVWYTTDGVSWTQATAGAGWSARQSHTTSVYDGKLWVLGGYDGACHNDVWCTTDGVNWTQATPSATWTGRYQYASAVYDGKVWVIGGNSNTSALNDVWYSIGSAEEECSYQVLFDQEWPILATDLGLNENSSHAPGNHIPERWGLAMVRTVLCNAEHPHHARTLEAYELNLAALELEPAEIAARVAPYKHILAALLLINQSRQDHFKELLGLTNDYHVVRTPGKALDEPFADDADLDGDGFTNTYEYDSIVSLGGSIDDFAAAATDPRNVGGAGLPTGGVFGLLLLITAIAIVLASRVSGQSSGFLGKR